MKTNWVKLMAMAMAIASWQALASQTKIIAWGDNTYGQTDVPTGLTNVVAIAQGGMHVLALNSDGTVTAWGYNYTWTTPVTYEGQATPPPGLSNVVAISAGYDSSLALKNDGTVAFWGDTGETNLPAGLTNIVAISTANLDSMVLRSDGVVIVWGSNVNGKTNVPSGITNVIGIVAGGANNAVLLSNNTVVVWGWNGYNQTNVPANATNIAAFALGLYHAVALRKDGTVVAWGYNGYGLTNVPAGLSNVVQVAAGDRHSLALKKDGTVVAWGYNNAGQTTIPSGLSNVVAISASRYQSLALANDGSPWIAEQPISQTTFGGMNVSFNVQAIGTTNVNYQWCFNGTNITGATSAWLSLTNVQTTNSGNYSVTVSNSIGSAVSSNAVLSVLNSLPIITVQPTNQNVALQSNAVMTAAATGSLPLYYQWLFCGTNIAKATNVSFSLTNAQFTNSGIYSVVVSNAFGSVTGLVATLTVMDLGIALNATNLTWTTSSSYPWFPETATNHDGVAAAQTSSTPFPQYSTLQTLVTGPGTLTFWAMQSSFFDFFRFSASGSNPQTVFVPPWPPWVQMTVYLGTGLQSLQWQFQPASFGPGYYGLDFAWLDQVSYVAGGTPPINVLITTNQTLPTGADVNLVVSALGTPPFSYQWEFNASNIAGATNATLVLTNLLPVNSGIYSVSITNNYGNVTTNVNLLVLPFAVNTDPTRLLMTTNGFQMQLDNVYASNSLIIWASTDLVNWMPILTNAPVTGTVQYVDSSVTNLPMRFYRAIEQ